MKSFFAIILFISVVVCSCHKDDPAPAPKPIQPYIKYYYIDTSMVHYKFKQGSYWVFENDTTHVLDSIVVDSISTGFVVTIPSVHGTSGTSESEFYKMYIHDFGASKYYNECLFGKSVYRNFGGDYNHFNGQAIYNTYSSIGATNTGMASGMSIVAKFPLMNINTNNFNNVDEVKITAANQYQPEFTYDTYLYYTDTIGLAKRETDLGLGNIESWSIKRWHVIK